MYAFQYLTMLDITLMNIIWTDSGPGIREEPDRSFEQRECVRQTVIRAEVDSELTFTEPSNFYSRCNLAAFELNAAFDGENNAFLGRVTGRWVGRVSCPGFLAFICGQYECHYPAQSE
jgi:hypothetical protein